MYESHSLQGKPLTLWRHKCFPMNAAHSMVTLSMHFMKATLYVNNPTQAASPALTCRYQMAIPNPAPQNRNFPMVPSPQSQPPLSALCHYMGPSKDNRVQRCARVQWHLEEQENLIQGISFPAHACFFRDMHAHKSLGPLFNFASAHILTNASGLCWKGCGLGGILLSLLVGVPSHASFGS